MNNITKHASKLAVAVVAVLGAPAIASAAALAIDADPAAGVQAAGTVPVGQSRVVTVEFTGDGATTNVSGLITYNTTFFNVTSSNANCDATGDTGNIALVTTNGATPLASSALCTLTFTATGAIGDSTPIDIVDATVNFADSAGANTIADGTLAIVDAPAGPVAPTIDLPAGPLAIAAGNAGTVGQVVVPITTTVDGSGGGTATVACTIPAGTVGFTAGAVTGNPFGAGDGSVTVSCTRGAAAASGTLTCTGTPVAPATGGNSDTVQIDCPAGTVVPVSGEFQANSLNVNLAGAPGSVAAGSATYSNVGDGPLTVSSCVASAGFTIGSTFPQVTAVGASNSIALSCTTPAAAGDSAGGTLTCTTDDPDEGEGTVTFALSCSAQVVSVPTMGSAGKGLLAAMIAAIGLLGFSLRRKLV